LYIICTPNNQVCLLAPFHGRNMPPWTPEVDSSLNMRPWPPDFPFLHHWALPPFQARICHLGPPKVGTWPRQATLAGANFPPGGQPHNRPPWLTPSFSQGGILWPSFSRMIFTYGGGESFDPKGPERGEPPPPHRPGQLFRPDRSSTRQRRRRTRSA